MFKRKPAVSAAFTVPAPTGGLNAYDSIAAMPSSDAIIMRNFYPEPYGVMVRKGTKQHAIGLNGDVETLMTYNSALGVRELFAVDQTGIYNISAPGVVDPADVIVGTTNARWQFTQFANAAGTHLIAFNGEDDGFWYTNGVYTPLVAGASPGPGVWEGIDPKKLIHVTAHQKRIWAVEKDSTRGWYLPPEQIFGAATSFDFGGLFTRGGFLQQLISWTIDSGTGPEDRLLAISSVGEIAAFSGINPSDPNDWRLDGVFFTGATFSRRCATKFGGDVLFLTQYGLLTMSAVLKGEETLALNTLSRKVQNALSEVISAGSDRFGWVVNSYPANNMLIVNAPGLIPSQTIQFVFNLVTQAWSIFTGWHAFVWINQNDSMFYGTTGEVRRAWEGYQDGVDLEGNNGTPILAECQQAFSYFDAPGANKHFKLIRPTMVFSGKFNYRVAANMDFDFETQPPPAAFGTTDFGIWDESLWDSSATWSGGAQSDKQWVSVVGIGYAAAVRIAVECNSETIWVSTDWVIEKGGIV